LRDEVTTPAGTTIYGLMLLESQGVKAGLMRVVHESSERGKRLGEEIDRRVSMHLEGQ
jgi:pyrroline-5-carboxylate reductase